MSACLLLHELQLISLDTMRCLNVEGVVHVFELERARLKHIGTTNNQQEPQAYPTHLRGYGRNTDAQEIISLVGCIRGTSKASEDAKHNQCAHVW